MPSLVARSSSILLRSSGCEYTSAVRVMLTEVATRWAVCAARGPISMLKKTCSHAPKLTSMSTASNKNVRPNSPSRTKEARFREGKRQRSLTRDPGLRSAGAEPSAAAIGHEHVAQAPHGLDEHRFGRIRLDQLAQAGNLHVQAAVEGFVLAAARQFHELVARQGNLGMAGEHLQDGEFAGGDRHLVAVARQRTGRQVQHVGAEGDGFVLLAGRPGVFFRAA